MSKKNIYGTRGDLFNSVEVGQVQRSGFDLSHDVKISMDMGKLTPIMCEEVLPGDMWNVNENVLMRFAPLAAPVMQKMDCYTHAFKVPYRLLMRLGDFEAFITGGEDNSGKNEAGEIVTLPYFTIYQIRERIEYFVQDSGDPGIDTDRISIFRELFSAGSLLDYLGFPTIDNLSNDEVLCIYNSAGNGDPFAICPMSIFPIRAYIKIYNEYYRDQRLIEKYKEFLDFGLVTYDEIDQLLLICSPYFRNMTSMSHDGLETNMFERAWKKDYFTSALPEAQLGTPVTLGIAGRAPVEGSVTGVGSVDVVVDSNIVTRSGVNYDPNLSATEFVSDGDHVYSLKASLDERKIGEAGENQMYADLSQASAVTIEQLRVATAVQSWLEKIMRVGSRLREMYQGFFGVTPDDASLQRPEFIGGGKTPVIVSETFQTSQSTDESVQGSVTGNAVTVGNFHAFKTFNKEYGLIMCIMSVLPSASYSQGLSRKLRGDRSKEDFAWPQFAHLGEQAIRNHEIYFNWDAEGSDQIDGEFGYQSRYAEYKYLPDEVHGDFKTSLDYWHLGRKFSTAPMLNGEFVGCSPDECNRIFNVTADSVNNNHLLAEIYFDAKVIRCLPKYGTPKFGL